MNYQEHLASTSFDKVRHELALKAASHVRHSLSLALLPLKIYIDQHHELHSIISCYHHGGTRRQTFVLHCSATKRVFFAHLARDFCFLKTEELDPLLTFSQRSSWSSLPWLMAHNRLNLQFLRSGQVQVWGLTFKGQKAAFVPAALNRTNWRGGALTRVKGSLEPWLFRSTRHFLLQICHSNLLAHCTWQWKQAYEESAQWMVAS